MESHVIAVVVVVVALHGGQAPRRRRSLGYDTLLSEAYSMPAHTTMIGRWTHAASPPNMPSAINAYLREHGQQPLQAPAAFARCILESLVLRYCQGLRHLERLTGDPITTIHDSLAEVSAIAQFAPESGRAGKKRSSVSPR